MANQEQLRILKGGVEAWNEWRKDNLELKIDLTGAKLTDAKLSVANLTGANLIGAFLYRANLEGADLKYANLTDAKPERIQALGTNFSSATLTGACIEDWNINSETNLDNVICDYIYLKEGKQERRPSDPNRNFELGDFAKLVQKSIETVDLIFKDGIDWKVFLSSYQDIQVEYGDQNISIQSIENKNDGAFVIRLSVPPDVDKANMETSFWQIYKPILKAKDEQIILYGQLLEDQRNKNTKLLTIIETMAHKEDSSLNEVQIKILQAIYQGNTYDRAISESLSLPIYQTRYYLEYFKDNGFITATEDLLDGSGYKAYTTCELTNKGHVAADNQKNLIKESNMSNNEYNFNAPVGSVGNHGTQTNVSGVVEGDQIGTQHNYASEEKQALAEAAAEIQKLLQQLESSNPSATEADKIAYVNDETTPSFKRRVVGALKAGSETAIEEFLDNPYVNVGKAVVKAWIKPE